MRNPFRSEADAFRILVMFVVAAGIVIAAALLVGSWLGVALAVVAIGIGLWSALGWLRAGLAERDEEPDRAPSPGTREDGDPAGSSS